MLHASGSLISGACSFTSHVFFERAFRAFSVERHGLLWDSTFAPARSAAGAGILSLYLVLDGAVEWLPTGPTCGAGALFLATETHLDGARGTREHTLRAHGEPFRSLELRIDPGFVAAGSPAAPRLLAGSPALFAAAEQLLGNHDAPTMQAFLRALEADGLLKPGTSALIRADEPEEIARCWRAITSCYLRIEPAPPLQTLADAAGVSLRQMSRDVQTLLATFPIGGDGFREYVTEVRLRWAVTLLSALPIDEVARAAGYGSIQALGRAFRNAGLPSPGSIKQQLRA